MTNAYQPTSLDFPTLQSDGRRCLARCGAILLLLTAPLWMVMSALESTLLNIGIINTKDLAPLVGNEHGTFTEYMLNVWHWDATIFLLFVAIIPNTALAIWLLSRRR